MGSSSGLRPPEGSFANLYVAISTLKGAQFTAVARLGTWLGMVVAAKSTKNEVLAVDVDLRQTVIENRIH